MGFEAIKPVFRVCEQQSRRPVWASTETDQKNLLFAFWKLSYLSLLQANFIFKLVSVAEETDLSLALSEIAKTSFVTSRPIFICYCVRSDIFTLYIA